MATDFITKIVRGASTLFLADPYDLSQWGEEELTVSIPAAEAPGTDGEWQGGGHAQARLVTLPGLLIGDNSDDLRGKFDVLSKALCGEAGGPELTVYKHSDRYITGRVSFLRQSEDQGLDYVRWTLGLRCADPFWYEGGAAGSLALSSGANAITPGGSYTALPVFTFVVTTIGTITLTYAATGEQFFLTPTATGTYTVDCGAGTVTLAPSTDALSVFSGEFLESGLLPDASSITLALSGGAVLSSASVEWRKRWHRG